MEVPAGGLSPGLTPEEAARRELLEEVGGEAAEMRYIGQFYTSNGISNERAYVYLATGVELGEAHQEPTELMELHLLPIEEILHMALEGEISDGPSALALLCCSRFSWPGTLLGQDPGAHTQVTQKVEIHPLHPPRTRVLP